MLAPIVLFVYNRPEHTLKTLEALAGNELASESVLYIYADGPKSNASDHQVRLVRHTRQVIRERKWCKDVIIKEAKRNKGLALSIVEGVTQVVKMHSKVIVLEDDIETSSGFLKYMNDALNVYEQEERVMHVSGYMFPVSKRLPETFFYNTASCWGWGTWKRAWQYYNHDANVLAHQIKNQNKIHEFDIEGYYPYYNSLLANAEGTKTTWAVRWYASFFLRGGYALHPYPSLTRNIGFDSTGVNCSTNDFFYWSSLAEKVKVNKLSVGESTLARDAVKEFYQQRTIPKKKKYALSRLKKVKKIIPASVKHYIKIRTSKSYQKYYHELLEERRLKALPRRTPTSTTFLGNTIKMVDAKSFLFIKKEVFEEEIYKFRTQNPSPLILDCGANIGLSILYFKQLYPEAHIVGFEPDVQVFRILEDNIRTYGLENIKLVRKGLWNEEKVLEFFAEGSDAGHLSASQKHDGNVIKVETTRLRNYLDRHVDFLKIDIEGAETEVLLDSKDKLHNVDKLFVEYHSFSGMEQKLSVLLEVLKETGFRYQIDSPGMRMRHPFVRTNQKAGMDTQLNIYAQK